MRLSQSPFESTKSYVLKLKSIVSIDVLYLPKELCTVPFHSDDVAPAE